jgi:hypothetical protein
LFAGLWSQPPRAALLGRRLGWFVWNRGCPSLLLSWWVENVFVSAAEQPNVTLSYMWLDGDTKTFCERCERGSKVSTLKLMNSMGRMTSLLSEPRIWKPLFTWRGRYHSISKLVYCRYQARMKYLERQMSTGRVF